MKNPIKRLKQNINSKNFGFALLGSMMIAFGTNMLANADIPEGGILGLCLIIEKIWGINSAVTSLVLNGLCCLLAWRLMGTRYMLNAAISTVGFSVFYALFHAFLPPLIDAKYWLLSALIGTILIEIGTGIALRFGSAPSGDHALSMAFVRKGGFDFGWINFLRDFTVIFASLCYADPYSVAYALLIMTLTAPISEAIVKARRKNDVAKRMARTKKGWVTRTVIGLLIVTILMGAAMYLNDIYVADENAIRDYKVEHVEEVALDDGVIAYVPEGEIKAGFVFYPGAKVEFTSYAPLLKKCADQGIVCVVIEMPYNFAFLGINKGARIPSYYPEVDTWYIGGHSLGGCIAATCADNNEGIFDGVILLGAYAVNDITDLKVLSVYGSNDGVRNASTYEKNKKNLPADFTERVIQGGNHAYFGMYGEQDGDGVATIKPEAQINETASYIIDFILK